MPIGPDLDPLAASQQRISPQRKRKQVLKPTLQLLNLTKGLPLEKRPSSKQQLLMRQGMMLMATTSQLPRPPRKQMQMAMTLTEAVVAAPEANAAPVVAVMEMIAEVAVVPADVTMTLTTAAEGEREAAEVVVIDTMTEMTARVTAETVGTRARARGVAMTAEAGMIAEAPHAVAVVASVATVVVMAAGTVVDAVVMKIVVLAVVMMTVVVVVGTTMTTAGVQGAAVVGPVRADVLTAVVVIVAEDSRCEDKEEEEMMQPGMTAGAHHLPVVTDRRLAAVVDPAPILVLANVQMHRQRKRRLARSERSDLLLAFLVCPQEMRPLKLLTRLWPRPRRP